MSEQRIKPDPVWMTSAMMKAYSHPLRRQIIRLFGRREHLRAADIAADLSVPANSVSFHLRVLADAGLIAEAPEHARDRRDRVWAAKKLALNVGGPESPVPDEELSGVMIRALAEEHHAMMQRVIAWTPEYVSGRDTDVHGAFTQRTLRLSVAEFDALLERINEAMDEAAESHDGSDPEARFWDLDLLAADDRI
ncbi:winged helix-turn-helix domain-containing protein [Microbacterium sp. LWH12-1.2]|uniref:winged helix-turn-helix domain-containing protein n=1 Tax=Microbacterium sp. LWH12-1.2 TaxID=3135259 RepID=UPI003435B3F2